MQIVNIVGTYICHWALKGSIVLKYVEYIAWALNVKVADLNIVLLPTTFIHFS
jgi:hypothetical protein